MLSVLWQLGELDTAEEAESLSVVASVVTAQLVVIARQLVEAAVYFTHPVQLVQHPLCRLYYPLPNIYTHVTAQRHGTASRHSITTQRHGTAS